jgi:DNA-binding IclR family transcriptional regulator
VTRYAYRLRAWPELPQRFRTAPVLRALSRMTLGPVTHTWFLDRTRLAPTEAERLLAYLVAREYVERIDFAASLDAGSG